MSGIAGRSQISLQPHSVPRCSRRGFHGTPWGQSIAPSQRGREPPRCEAMAKPVVSAVKPGEQATWPCSSGFLVCGLALGVVGTPSVFPRLQGLSIGVFVYI